VEDAHSRSVKRALQEERLGLAAIVKAFLLECPEPENARRLLARLDAMADGAANNPRVSAKLRQALIDGALFVRTAIERETGRPQSLLAPHVGHVAGGAVDRLISDGDQPSLLGAQAAHDERNDTIIAVQEALVRVLREGAATDAEIEVRYRRLAGVPQHAPGALLDRRKELTADGRISDSGSRHKGQPMWVLVEQA
jgi:hypothetical protein